MKAKPALLYWAAANVICPVCHEPIPNLKDGSFLWTQEQVLTQIKTEPVITCSCGASVRLRKKVEPA